MKSNEKRYLKYKINLYKFNDIFMIKNIDYINYFIINLSYFQQLY